MAERIEVSRRSARWEVVRLRAPRILFTTVLAILSLIGLREVVFPEKAPPAPPAPDINVDQAAESTAELFARAYLTYDAARPEARERALTAFVGTELDSGAGFIPERGSQEVLWTQVAQNQAAIAGGRVIVVAAQTSKAPEPIYLAVPIERRENGELQITGYPSLIGPPAVAGQVGTRDREEVADGAVLEVTRRALRNYLAAEEGDLEADLTPKATVALPTVELSVGTLDEVVWADGDRSAVLATIEAFDAQGNSFLLTYEVGISFKESRPLVTFIETEPTTT